MQNIAQPFINLTNANINAFTRFAQAEEITNLNKANTEKYVEQTRDYFGRLNQSTALTEWRRALVDNYTRFFNEYAQTMFQLASQAPQFLTRQMETALQRVSEGVEATARTMSRAAEETGESSRRMQEGSDTSRQGTSQQSTSQQSTGQQGTSQQETDTGMANKARRAA